MTRREFIALLGGTAVAQPLVSRAQQPNRVRRIGMLMPTEAADPESKRRLEVFLRALGEAGWAQDRDFVLEPRYAEGKLDRLPALAAELVGSGVDVILTTGTESVTAAQKATSTIPIIMATIGDPVSVGVVASLAKPGGNVTGLSLLGQDLSAKRVEIIKECLPHLARAAVLWNPNNASVVLKFKETETAARAVGVQTTSFEFRRAADLEPGFEAVARWGAEALITADETLLVSNRRQVIDLATRYRLPVMSEFGVLAGAGALMSYGPSVPDLWRRSASYVDKVLKGARPGELPVEQPTKFELRINAKTARELGLTIPDSLLARADEVIE